MHFDIILTLILIHRHAQRLKELKDQRPAGIPPPITAGRAGTPLPAWNLASPRRVRQGVLGEGWVESGLVVLNLGIPPLITAGRAWAEGCWADHKDSEQGLKNVFQTQKTTLLGRLTERPDYKDESIV